MASLFLVPRVVAIFAVRQGLCSALRPDSERSGIRLELELPEDFGRLPENAEMALFRIVQEALSNVVKHSAAQKVRVTLTGAGDRIDLRIEDSGIGFDPESSQNTATLGLISMRERVRLIGGQFSIESEPSVGTRIRVQAPITRIAAQPEDR